MQPSVPSTTDGDLIVAHERQVRRCLGVESDLLFCDFEGRPLTPRQLRGTADALRSAFTAWAGGEAQIIDDIAPWRIAQALRRSLGHSTLSMAKYFHPRKVGEGHLERFQASLAATTNQTGDDAPFSES